MTNSDTLKAKIDIKQMELNALLEITQSINDNLPESKLYKIYEFTIRGNLNIKKLALYVMDDQWECKVNFGTKAKFLDIPPDESFLNYEKIEPLKLPHDSPFGEFQVIVPIAHKSRKLAFVLISGYDNGEINTNFIQALSNIIIVAIENKKLARKQMEQDMMRRELEIAGNVQSFLFPKKLPQNDEIKVDTFYKPHHSIGGDYYDFITINENQIMFCIADVSGKGIPAALLMSNFQASLRTLVRKTTILKDIVNELNYLVMSNAEGQHFITFFVALYDKELKRLKYVNSGHNPPILVKNNDAPEMLTDGSTVLGAFRELPFLNVGIIENIYKFLFCGFTDGLTEITNSRGEEFGDAEILKVINQNIGSEPAELNAAIIADMEEFKGKNGFMDDITLFTCKVDTTKKL